MDYEQHMPGRSSYDPSRARGEMHREGGIGSVLFIIAVIVAALAIVIWLAGGEGTRSGAPATADPAVAVPADGSAAPAATDATAPAVGESQTAPAAAPSE
ncbi:hypothetical protein DEA8626_02936 [Defluviimonas aquaemixtae]|uniref:Uncharacterized protein n=1 Tax=Albidovulum aquaemixtae TaxID=1542388 RepID=A0A2R8BKH0_9RHOB|nr:hypothetical protein [Defluviimonas aquaemixtae]SPH23865.1 hypothetical protein DEA8626_02936 [Defluviimonas aquaemixtae]